MSVYFQLIEHPGGERFTYVVFDHNNNDVISRAELQWFMQRADGRIEIREIGEDSHRILLMAETKRWSA